MNNKKELLRSGCVFPDNKKIHFIKSKMKETGFCCGNVYISKSHTKISHKIYIAETTSLLHNINTPSALIRPLFFFISNLSFYVEKEMLHYNFETNENIINNWDCYFNNDSNYVSRSKTRSLQNGKRIKNNIDYCIKEIYNIDHNLELLNKKYYYDNEPLV